MELQKINSVSIQAMSLNIPNDSHPNKMPFSGILTRIGEPSDSAPEGANGSRIMITAEAAKKNLDSLLGMAVDYQPTFEGHNPQAKIGIITAATIEGNAIHIRGFIYAADFPDLAAEIKANKHNLGFSFEARELLTDNAEADPIPIVDCIFTGAAILLKEKAAYKTTSLAAKAADIEEDTMSKELQDQVAALAGSLTKIGEAVAALSTEVADLKKMPEKVQAASLMPKVAPHVDRLNDAADRMEKDGIGAHPSLGHAAVLRHMGACMAADAAHGKMPHIYEGANWIGASGKPEVKKDDLDMDAKVIAEAVKAATADFTKQLDTIKAAADKQIAEVKAAAVEAEKKLGDELAATKTKLADIEAKAVDKVEAPKRKTLSVMASAMLSKTGIELPEEGQKLDTNKLNEVLAKSSMTSSQRFALKTEMAHAGLID